MTHLFSECVLAMEAEQKRGKTKRLFGTQPKKKTRPGPDDPNTSGWYGRLRGPILLLSVSNYDSNLFICSIFLIKLIPPGARQAEGL